jgi:hypothetical protein
VHASVLAPLAAAAVTIGALHSFAPDHWLPIAAVGRARRWSVGRTARVALLCGFGHVTVSVLLGLVGLIGGRTVATAVGDRSAAISGVLLIGFGVAYGLWGLRRAIAHRLHGHHHQAAGTTVSGLFAIYCADPCVAVIPILFAAAALPAWQTVGIVVVYEAATIGTIVALTVVARAGASVLRGRWVERWGDGAAGISIVVTGIAVAILGW